MSKKLTATFELAPGEIKGIYGPLVQEKVRFFRLLAGLSDQGFESGHYVIR